MARGSRQRVVAYLGELDERGRAGVQQAVRPDCKQVNIALVVSRGGLPLGYKVFAGNRGDVTTVEEIVTVMEDTYGCASRIWVMDRGMVSAEDVEFLKKGGWRYILGTPRSMLRKFERQLLEESWSQVHAGLEVRLCAAPDDTEVFIRCRSAERGLKEADMHARFEQRMEQKLRQMAASWRVRKHDPLLVAQWLGKLLGRNSRAAGLFQVHIHTDARGGAHLQWSQCDDWRDWARLSEGCYLLRSNVTDWSGEEPWRASMPLTEAEAAFRLRKNDLALRPVWHHLGRRVQAHILVCFLTCMLWKTLGRWCQDAGLGDEPRSIFAELQQIRLVDVVLPSRSRISIRRRCVSRPTQRQAILLQRLGLEMPSCIEFANV